MVVASLCAYSQCTWSNLRLTFLVSFSWFHPTFHIIQFKLWNPLTQVEWGNRKLCAHYRNVSRIIFYILRYKISISFLMKVLELSSNFFTISCLFLISISHFQPQNQQQIRAEYWILLPELHFCLLRHSTCNLCIRFGPFYCRVSKCVTFSNNWSEKRKEMNEMLS